MDMKMIAKIKKTNDGVLHGELNCKFFEEPFLFSNIMDMVEMMEIAFDTKGFPERQFLPRAFGDKTHRIRKNEIDLPTLVKERSLPQIPASKQQPGIVCTFEILVRYRHNAEWQGSVHLLEKNITTQFKSIIELVMYIDNALSDTVTCSHHLSPDGA